MTPFIFTAKIPSANSSLKDAGGFHHCMLVLSKDPIDAMGPAYTGPLRHILAYRCGNYKGTPDACGRQLFPGCGIISLIQLIFCRKWLNHNVLVKMPLFDTRLPVGPMQVSFFI